VELGFFFFLEGYSDVVFVVDDWELVGTNVVKTT
jgi:hypothetical protein